MAVLCDWGSKACFLYREILWGSSEAARLPSPSLLSVFIWYYLLLICFYLVLLVPVTGSLGFEHGDLEYMSNTTWSTQTHWASLEGLQLLPLVMELWGNLCKVWGGTRFPVPAVRVPGPGGDPLNRVGATVQG